MTAASQFLGKKAFVTGHTGFKGAWLSMLLHRLGARVTGYALAPPTEPSLFVAARAVDCCEIHHEADVRDATRLAAAIRECSPDVVFHLAAQPLVRQSYREPLETLAVNVMGTASVLEAVRTSGSACSVIVVTSDKCYEPHDDGRAHAESDVMGGRDPYSASKGAAELVAAAYRRSYFPPERLSDHGVQVATARAGNVIGGGDWAEDRIVADIVRNLSTGRAVPVRNAEAVRPWQHVLEPLRGYLSLAAAMLERPDPRWSSGWNFGPDASQYVPVRELVSLFVDEWGTGRWEDAHDPQAPGETHVLRLTIDKAVSELGWQPRLTAQEAIRRTARWYSGFYSDPSAARSLCERDIESYFDLRRGHRPTERA